jgi:hypothetical protein
MTRKFEQFALNPPRYSEHSNIRVLVLGGVPMGASYDDFMAGACEKLNDS